MLSWNFIKPVVATVLGLEITAFLVGMGDLALALLVIGTISSLVGACWRLHSYRLRLVLAKLLFYKSGRFGQKILAVLHNDGFKPKGGFSSKRVLREAEETARSAYERFYPKN